MKKLNYLSIALIALLSVTSCKKDSTEPDNTTTPTTNNNTGGNNNNTGGNNNNGNTTPDWNYSGTEPISAKVDGTVFLGDPQGYSVVQQQGTFLIDCNDNDPNNYTKLIILMPNTVEAGNEYDIKLGTNFQLQFIDYGNGNKQFISKTGKFKIISKTATTLEGKFYADLEEFQNSTSTKTVTEGYFKVDL